MTHAIPSCELEDLPLVERSVSHQFHVRADLGAEINAWTIDYTVNITAGTAVEISIIDANNEEAWSGTVSILSKWMKCSDG